MYEKLIDAETNRAVYVNPEAVVWVAATTLNGRRVWCIMSNGGHFYATDYHIVRLIGFTPDEIKEPPKKPPEEPPKEPKEAPKIDKHFFY